MDKFINELGKHTEEGHKNAKLEMIKDIVGNMSKEEIAKKIEETSNTMPDKVKVTNLTKEKILDKMKKQEVQEKGENTKEER